MSNLLGDIEYNEEEYLNLGASYPNINQNLDTEINVIDLTEEETEETENEEQDEERIENIELEARFVANRIKKLIDEKYQSLGQKERNIQRY